MNVHPSLTYRDVETAIQFLRDAFGFEPVEVGADAEGNIRFASMQYGDGLVLLQPDLPEELHGSHLGHGWVYVSVPDVDSHYERARAAGAILLGPPHDAFDGGLRGYSVRDHEGNLWSFATEAPGNP